MEQYALQPRHGILQLSDHWAVHALVDVPEYTSPRNADPCSDTEPELERATPSRRSLTEQCMPPAAAAETPVAGPQAASRRGISREAFLGFRSVRPGLGGCCGPRGGPAPAMNQKLYRAPAIQNGPLVRLSVYM